MIQDDPELLHQMMADEPRQADIYRPGPYWLPYQRRTTRAIARWGIGDFRARPAVGKGYSDAVFTDPRAVWQEQDAVRRWLKTVVSRLPVVAGMLDDYAGIVRAQGKHLQRLRTIDYAERWGDLGECPVRC